MRVTRVSTQTDREKLLHTIGVDSGGVSILSSKMQHYLISIEDLLVGGANILKQDALSIGADLAVPRGTVIAQTSRVNTLLIATKKQLKILAKKELAQPFGLKEVAKELQKIVDATPPQNVEIMGVLNANDDSFFSGSRFIGSAALDHIAKMKEDGADIIDIGGVSSKPNAQLVSADEELQRIKPIVDALYDAKFYNEVKLSIDSYEPSVISYVLERGFHIVNDITGLRDSEILKLCATYGAVGIAMHMQGTPQTMQKNPTYESVVGDVYAYLEESLQKADAYGVKDLVIDVGIGFGKRLEHNVALIQNLEHFLTLGVPILVGASRKSMIDMISPSSVEERLAGTLAIHLQAVQNGASILRVHDVYEHKQALAVQKMLQTF